MKFVAPLVASMASISLVSAEPAPGYGGYRLAWTDGFDGASATKPDQAKWNIVTNVHVNNEEQIYTTSTRNLQKSGGQTLQIIPWKDGGQWTSGRIESKYVFQPQAGRITVAEAKIRFGDNKAANKRGLWPAFWLLGDSIRHGTGWPKCGEVDILETVNGQLTGHGTVHCQSYPGGVCNEPNGIGASTDIPDQGWHRWSVVWNRQVSNWQGETITWYMDGRLFHQISGARVGDFDAWKSLAQSPLFFILNVAVGGSWPGPSDGNTSGGYGSMMEVAYVAHYVSQ